MGASKGKFRKGQNVLLKCKVYKIHGDFILVDTSNDPKYVVTVCVEEKQLRREAGPARKGGRDGKP